MLYSQTNISVQFVFLAGFALSAPWRTIECFFNCRDFFFFFFDFINIFQELVLQTDRDGDTQTNKKEMF